jgi:protein-L-isoaspartate(D-aspartate) O-methyltransferase
VIAADATIYDLGAVDLIVASAGATHLQKSWLDSLNCGGRLIVPLTADDRAGAMLLVSRHAAQSYAARFICPVGFIEFTGARDEKSKHRLRQAFDRGEMSTVKSLRRDHHSADDTCWLHGEGWCPSRLEPAAAAPLADRQGEV